MSEERHFETAIQTLSVTAGIYDDNARTFAAVGNDVTARRFAALRDQLIAAITILKQAGIARQHTNDKVEHRRG